LGLVGWETGVEAPEELAAEERVGREPVAEVSREDRAALAELAAWVARLGVAEPVAWAVRGWVVQAALEVPEVLAARVAWAAGAEAG
jgi:hypothetical protein